MMHQQRIHRFHTDLGNLCCRRWKPFRLQHRTAKHRCCGTGKHCQQSCIHQRKPHQHRLHILGPFTVVHRDHCGQHILQRGNAILARHTDHRQPRMARLALHHPNLGRYDLLQPGQRVIMASSQSHYGTAYGQFMVLRGSVGLSRNRWGRKRSPCPQLVRW